MQQINKIEDNKQAIMTKDASKDLSDSKNIIQTASVIDSVSSSSTDGFWTRLIGIPARGIKSLISIFYDF